MIDKLINVANIWSSKHPGVKVDPIQDAEGQLVELTWQRAGGDFAYIDLFPETGDAVIVQHGTYTADDRRNPCGMTRIASAEIASNLDRLKESLATVVSQGWTYKPSVEIGVVSSLKFH